MQAFAVSPDSFARMAATAECEHVPQSRKKTIMMLSCHSRPYSSCAAVLLSAILVWWGQELHQQGGAGRLGLDARAAGGCAGGGDGPCETRDAGGGCFRRRHLDCGAFAGHRPVPPQRPWCGCPGALAPPPMTRLGSTSSVDGLPLQNGRRLAAWRPPPLFIPGDLVFISFVQGRADGDAWVGSWRSGSACTCQLNEAMHCLC